jgi:hypothetical protein
MEATDEQGRAILEVGVDILRAGLAAAGSVSTTSTRTSTR